MKSRRVFVEREMQFSHCFGEALRGARKEKNWTQRDLAERSNATTPAVSRWETGQVAPTLNTALELAEVLELPLVVLIERAVVMWESLEEEDN